MAETAKPTEASWFLRFAGDILAVAGILLALPGGEVQAQSAEYDPNDCANPCYVLSPFHNEEFDAANSRADCDRILQEVLKKIKKKK